MAPFVAKNWQDTPSTVTPVNAAALEDLETRVTNYADTQVIASLDTSSPLGASDTFYGPPVDLGVTGGVAMATALADQDGTLYIEDSTDATTWRRVTGSATATIGANKTASATLPTVRRYVRRVYVNGATVQGSLELTAAAA